MSKYTIELDKLIKTGYDIGLKDYPIFDEVYRKGLNERIVDHFRYREIGVKEPGKFKFFINRELNEQMPYFNQLYKSAKLVFNPLFTKDYKEDVTKHNAGSVTGNNSSESNIDNTTAIDETKQHTGNDYDLHQDTPQGNLASLDNQTHLTDARKMIAADTDINTGSNNTAQTVTNTATTGNNTENNETLLNSIKGYDGVSPSEMLLKYRETFLNIDLEVFNSLECCFMGVF